MPEVAAICGFARPTILLCRRWFEFFHHTGESSDSKSVPHPSGKMLAAIAPVADKYVVCGRRHTGEPVHPHLKSSYDLNAAGFHRRSDQPPVQVSDSHIYVFVNLRGDQRPDYCVVKSKDVARRVCREVEKKTGSVWYSFSPRTPRSTESQLAIFARGDRFLPKRQTCGLPRSRLLCYCCCCRAYKVCAAESCSRNLDHSSSAASS